MQERGREADRKRRSGRDRERKKREEREEAASAFVLSPVQRYLSNSIAEETTLVSSIRKGNKILYISRCVCLHTLSTVLSLLFLRCAFLSHLLTEIHCYSGATYFLGGSKHKRTLWLLLARFWHHHPGLPILQPPLTGRALVRRRRRWVGCEVDAGGDGGWLRALHLPTHLLGEEGEVLPQLGHTNLQLVALAQQLLLLAHLGS